MKQATKTAMMMPMTVPVDKRRAAVSDDAEAGTNGGEGAV